MTGSSSGRHCNQLTTTIHEKYTSPVCGKFCCICMIFVTYFQLKLCRISIGMMHKGLKRLKTSYG